MNTDRFSAEVNVVTDQPVHLDVDEEESLSPGKRIVQGLGQSRHHHMADSSTVSPDSYLSIRYNPRQQRCSSGSVNSKS